MTNGNEALSLEQAIRELDPAIDAHWTKKGEPTLNALKELTGHAVTRAEANEATPAVFNRNTAAEKALDEITETGPTTGRDYVGDLDEIFAGLTNQHRIFTEALYRLGMYYKSERENIKRQIEGSRERRRDV